MTRAQVFPKLLPLVVETASLVSLYGMSKRDIVPNIDFLMNVPIQQNGDLAIVDGVSRAGDHVEIRAEMDVICVISNCPQSNNPCNGFNPTPVRVTISHPTERDAPSEHGLC